MLNLIFLSISPRKSDICVMGYRTPDHRSELKIGLEHTDICIAMNTLLLFPLVSLNIIS